MEGERSRDDRAKGFFEIRKISVFILLDELIESSSMLPFPDTATESYQQAK